MVTSLAVINPVVCGVMLMQIDARATTGKRLADASKAAVSVLIILIVSALSGRTILQFFGISMDAFQIVGGVIIASIGFSMFAPGAKAPRSGPKQKQSVSTIIMFAASPGTIATVISLAAIHHTKGVNTPILIAVGLAVALTWLIMVLMALTSGRIKAGGQKMFTRFLGLILIAMGLQFVLVGYKDFMTT